MNLFILIVTINLVIFSAGCSQNENNSTPTSNYLVVISKSQVINRSQGGSIKVPNNSIGVDTRAGWI